MPKVRRQKTKKARRGKKRGAKNINTNKNKNTIKVNVVVGKDGETKEKQQTHEPQLTNEQYNSIVQQQHRAIPRHVASQERLSVENQIRATEQNVANLFQNQQQQLEDYLHRERQATQDLINSGRQTGGGGMLGGFFRRGTQASSQQPPSTPAQRPPSTPTQQPQSTGLLSSVRKRFQRTSASPSPNPSPHRSPRIEGRQRLFGDSGDLPPLQEEKEEEEQSEIGGGGAASPVPFPPRQSPQGGGGGRAHPVTSPSAQGQNVPPKDRRNENTNLREVYLERLNDARKSEAGLKNFAKQINLNLPEKASRASMYETLVDTELGAYHKWANEMENEGHGDGRIPGYWARRAGSSSEGGGGAAEGGGGRAADDEVEIIEKDSGQSAKKAKRPSALSTLQSYLPGSGKKKKPQEKAPSQSSSPSETSEFSFEEGLPKGRFFPFKGKWYYVTVDETPRRVFKATGSSNWYPNSPTIKGKEAEEIVNAEQAHYDKKVKTWNEDRSKGREPAKYHKYKKTPQQEGPISGPRAAEHGVTPAELAQAIAILKNLQETQKAELDGLIASGRVKKGWPKDYARPDLPDGPDKEFVYKILQRLKFKIMVKERTSVTDRIQVPVLWTPEKGINTILITVLNFLTQMSNREEGDEKTEEGGGGRVEAEGGGAA